MAYAVEQIVINGIPVKDLTELKIDCSPGGHGNLWLSGYLAGENGEETLFRFSENDSITVCVGEGNLLFSGILTKVSVAGAGETVKISAEVKSRSILMDQKKRSRSFQDVNMTYSQLFQTILSEYPGSDIKLSIPDRPLGEIAVQYKETDWEFLKRMLSMLNAVLACRPGADSIKLYGGVPEIPQGKWEYEKTGFRKEMGEYSYWLLQGGTVHDNDFLIMDIETNHVPEFFEQIEDKGRKFVIRSFSYELVRGLIYCRCQLQKKEGILARMKYPMHLIGVALQGTVLEVAGTRIKIHLDIDHESGTEDVYWFPFSTLSASTDGSGWYYMPEKGDNVRVYFPSKYTKDAIAVSAVSSYDGKNGGVPDRMGSPSTKYLSNPYGQEMKLAEDGVYLACSGGSASVKIGKDGDVTLNAKGTINIAAENNLEIAAEEAVSLKALETAVVSCVKGGTIQMPADGKLYIQGTEVKVD
ncbi:contractile injection system protein, VgrG/Pvc8 family [Clostridium sp. Marseille-P2415]|uniref:contractile injection system protein, VgrG/Pvc8 family n=1 Tax=Clostridium sp. Marseille-P2415 TaxID=1805471 RepID=UPI0009884AC8|nr:contractile injection system protein, VgrG/Pvc8 family [Clostridium sp. Marseille-P2415]